jgi:siroheme synthase
MIELDNFDKNFIIDDFSTGAKVVPQVVLKDAKVPQKDYTKISVSIKNIKKEKIREEERIKQEEIRKVEMERAQEKDQAERARLTDKFNIGRGVSLYRGGRSR